MGVSQIFICVLVSQRLWDHGEKSMGHKEQDVSMTWSLFCGHYLIVAVSQADSRLPARTRLIISGICLQLSLLLSHCWPGEALAWRGSALAVDL